MKKFWQFSRRYFTRHFWWYFGGFISIFITQYFNVYIVDLAKNAIDSVSLPGATAGTVLPFIWKIVFLALALLIARTASRMMFFTPARKIEYDVRNDYYARILFLQRDFLSKHQSGDLVSRCSNDIGFIRTAYGFGALQVFNVAVTLVLVSRAMVNLDLRITVYLAIPLIVSFTIIQTNIRLLFKHWKESNILIGKMSSLVMASYKAISAIQNYHAEPHVIGRFGLQNDTYLKNQHQVISKQAFVFPLIMMVGNISTFLILWAAGLQVIDGNLTLGEITAFLGYIGMILPPLMGLGWMLNVFNQALPAIDRLDEILLAPSTLLESKPAPGLVKGQPVKLSLRNLEFHYASKPDDPKPFSLQSVDLELPQGKVLGIVGTLGCGKTTLLDTLMRLNGPMPGNMFLNEHDAAYISLELFREQFAFAPQQAFLFSTTLRNNLLISFPAEKAAQVDDAYLIRYLDFAGFDLDPKQFPDGLETQVGQKGIMLSGGQRQRIVLARALLKDAAIYVLDDVLSAVDHETEKRIVANIRTYAPGKSFIIASHRVSAVQWADEILVMDEGRIIDRGTHQELSSRPGFYQDIYRYQSSSEGVGA